MELTNAPHTIDPARLARGNSLDTNLDAFRDGLQQASDVVLRLYEGLATARVTPASSRREVASLFDEPLPEEPQRLEELLREVESRIVANAVLSLSPRFFGYINGSGNQAAVLAELLAAAMNQICARWHFSPAASEVERRVIGWMAEFIGYPAEAGSHFLSGGSAGNLVALAAARTRNAGFDAALMGMHGGPLMTAYVSEEGHASLDKSMALLGMGRNQLRKIGVLADFTIDLDRLAKQVNDDRRSGYRPICVVANAGTTNTGAVDPLDALADFCREQELWFHVDAAYGGPAAGTESAGALFRGLARADSVVVNPHKWLYLPVEAAVIMVRDAKALRDTFQIVADYLPGDGDADSHGALDFKDYGPQLSRSFRALKVWMTFKAYGAQSLRAAIESNIRIMQYLADQIDRSQDFVRLAPVPLSVVCFQYRTPDPSVHDNHVYLNELNKRLLPALEKDGRVFLSGTKIHGRQALRACSVNHRLRRDDVDLLLRVIRDVGTSLTRTSPASLPASS